MIHDSSSSANFDAADLDNRGIYGIVYNTMNLQQIRRLRRRIGRARLRRASTRHRQIVRLVRAVGRRLNRKRGKEPTWEKDGRPPLTVPNHPGEMSPITVDNILDMLEEDLDYEEGIGNAS